MERRTRISLDDPAFRGRVRRNYQTTTSRYRPQSPVNSFQSVSNFATQNISDIGPKTTQITTPVRTEVLAKQFPGSKESSSKKHFALVPTMLSVLALMLFGAGVLITANSFRTDKTVKAQVRQLAVQSEDNDDSTTLPAEDNPPDISSYNVASDLPKILNIDEIGVKARIKRMGVDKNNAIKAPTNIYDVGWYDGSAKPGEPGTVVLDGHVSGPTKLGVFYGIKTLKPGSKVSLIRGDNKVITYTVTGSQTYNADDVDMAKVMTSSVEGKPGLNLITCAGKFDAKTNKFAQRVVVFTIQD